MILHGFGKQDNRRAAAALSASPRLPSLFERETPSFWIQAFKSFQSGKERFFFVVMYLNRTFKIWFCVVVPPPNSELSQPADFCFCCSTVQPAAGKAAGILGPPFCCRLQALNSLMSFPPSPMSVCLMKAPKLKWGLEKDKSPPLLEEMGWC